MVKGYQSRRIYVFRSRAWLFKSFKCLVLFFFFYKHGGFEYHVEVVGAVNSFTNRNRVHLLNLLSGVKR